MLGRMNIPLFPLNIVLFSGAHTALNIFEPRYVRMTRHCLATETGFGVVGLRTGSEVADNKDDTDVEIYQTATLASIVHHEESEKDRFLLILVGGAKVTIHTTWKEDDRLLMGEVSFLPDEAEEPITPQNWDLVQLLQMILEQDQLPTKYKQTNYESARDVSMRLAQVLPLPLHVKQKLLQMNNGQERLKEIREWIRVRRG